MREISKEKILHYGVAIVCVAASAPLLHRIRRTRGKNPLWHLLFLAGVTAALMLVPETIQDEIFSAGGVVVIGTLLPVYESIVTICSVDEQDDAAWLQFWITSATVSFATEFMDDITAKLPSAGEHWFEVEFFFNLWLLFPLTDGAALIFDNITKPYIAPIARKFKDKCEGYIGSLLLVLVNTSHMWILWFALTTLPEEARRFLVVALGTVYPIAASIVAVTTETSGLHDTHWLTYWTTFSLLFVCMDYVENFVGNIRGFYSICAAAVLYLLLPMFNGADVVFRRVLVPLSGQYEKMLLHDAYAVKRSMVTSLHPDQHERVFEKTALIFLKNKSE